MKTDERTEKIMKLGLFMITEGFSKEEVTATMNAIHVEFLTTWLATHSFKKKEKSK